MLAAGVGVPAVTRWRLGQETYGEDTFLSGELARSFVQGLQGQHPRYIKASAGCKHFSVHGGPENIPVSRLSFDAKVSAMGCRGATGQQVALWARTSLL